jgi:putative AdoMet-dependent methyltransferase
MERPDWYYVDLKQVGLDFADVTQVESYDERQADDPADGQALLAQLGVGASQVVADFGCGTGMLACEAAKLAGFVHAVDISAEMLRATLARAKVMRLANLTAHQAGFLSYEIVDGSLDLITTKFALHHLPDLWKGVALSRLHRSLKPGGRLFIRDVVFSCDPAEVPDVAESWINWMGSNTGYSRAEVAQHIREEHSTYSWVMAGLIERAGFRIVHADYSQRIYADYLAEKVSA